MSSVYISKRKSTLTAAASALFALSIGLVFAFQNFTFTDYMASDKAKVDEDSRQTHAKELLGRKFDGSDAAKVDQESQLHVHIFNKVFESLPIKYKDQSAIIAKTIIEQADKADFDPVFVYSIIKTESRFNPLARGTSGEIGLMQLMPKTAKWLAYRAHVVWRGKKTLKNPVNNIKIGVAYLTYLREEFSKNALHYVSAYNVGPKHMSKLLAKSILPKHYSRKVMKNYENFYSAVASFTAVPRSDDIRVRMAEQPELVEITQ